MDFTFTSDQLKRRDEYRKFAREYIEPFAAEADLCHSFPRRNIECMAKRGYMGLPIPKEWNGQGLDFLSYILLIEEISRACAATGVILAVHTSVGTFPVLYFGNQHQKEKYLPKLASGEWLGGFALTEAKAGSDPAGLATIARRDGDHYLLNGTKLFITNGGEADVYVVFATLDPAKRHKAITAFLVDKDTPGLIIGKNENKMGLNGSATVELILEDARVPVNSRLGEENEGFRIALSLLDGGRIGIAAQGLGIAAAALYYVRDYLIKQEESVYNVKIPQGKMFILADLFTRLEAAKLLVYRAAFLKNEGMSCTKESSMAKMTATDLAMDAASKALTLMEIKGITSDHPVERFFRDAKITQIYEGTNQIQRMVIARELLKNN